MDRSWLGRFRLLVWGLIAWAGLPVAIAHAYGTNGGSFAGSWPVIPYYINASSFPASVGTQAEVIRAIRKGADHWNFDRSNFLVGHHARMSLVYMGTTTVATSSSDGTNVVYYKTGNCSASQGDCIARADWWPATGNRTDFDITFYEKDSSGTNVDWKADPNFIFGTDLWGYAAHEFGHALGLSHSSVTVATMNDQVGPGAQWLRYLTTDDTDGQTYLYPANTDTTVTKSGNFYSIVLDFDDSVGLSYQFWGALNGTSPGIDLSPYDAQDFRYFHLNELIDVTAYYPIFTGGSGTLNASGQGTMVFDSTGLSGLCMDLAAWIYQSGWPNGLRHITEPVHICVP